MILDYGHSLTMISDITVSEASEPRGSAAAIARVRVQPLRLKRAESPAPLHGAGLSALSGKTYISGDQPGIG